EADPPAQASHRSGGSLRHDGSLLLGHGTHCATCETRLGGTESLLVRGRIILDQRPDLPWSAAESRTEIRARARVRSRDRTPVPVRARGGSARPAPPSTRAPRR